MRIKRIEADNIVDAMRELRRELGDHALILHTRQLAPTGVTGWFKSARIEILGAVDEPGVFAGGRAASSEPPPTLAPLPSPAARAALNAEGVSTFARMQQQAAARTSEPRRSVTVTAADLQRQAVIERLARFRAANPSAPIALEAVATNGATAGAQPDLRPEAAPAADLLASAAAPATDTNGPAGIGRELVDGIKFGRGEWSRIGRRARRIAFVGPTGAGKTTTLAKLAARAQLDHGCRIGLITIDTYRIGAVPQLGAYADILKVPLEVANTPEELSHALACLADRDIVFIDTIGRSPLGGGVDGLVPFLATAGADEVHLVLSATTRPDDSIRAARSFARLVPNRLVITKVDETDDYGALAAVSRATALPLAWLGVGQEVPDDLEPATPQRIGELLAAAA